MKWFVLTCALALLACSAFASSDLTSEVDPAVGLDENALHMSSYGGYGSGADGFDKSKLGCSAGEKFPCGKECKTFYKEEKYYISKPVKYNETKKVPYYEEVPYKTYETKKVPYYETTYAKEPCGYEYEKKDGYGKKDEYGKDDYSKKDDYGYSYRTYGYGYKDSDGYGKKDDGYGKKDDGYDKKDYGYEKKVKYCKVPKKVLKYKEEKYEKVAYKKELRYKEEKVEKVKYEKEEKTKQVPYEVCYQWYCKSYTCIKHVDVQKIEADEKKY